MPVEVKKLTHVYMPDSPFMSIALTDVTFDIADGEFIGLIGHTGSGKSTLVQHLNGLIKPTSGTLVVDGLDLTRKETNLRDVRKRVGLVFQYPEYQLFEETALADVMFGPKNLGLSTAEAEARAREALRQVGLCDESVYTQSPFELSGGQKRRVAIAGVVAMRPDILIMDEPTAGLDPRGRDDILALMRGIHAGGGVTLIMVSHSMADVSRLCDRLLVMNKGRLALSGTPAEVFKNGERLREMGLDLPPCARLAEKLRAAGFDMPEAAFDVPALKRAILASLTPKGGSANVQ